MNVNKLRKKYYKKYIKEGSGEDEVPINNVVFFIFGAVFLSIVLAVLTQRFVKPIAINPFILLAVVFTPAVLLTYLAFLSIKYFNLRIFTDRYSFSTIYTDIKDLPTEEVKLSTGEKTKFSIIPLGSAIIPNFIPIRGGREGFLVVDKALSINLGGTIFIKSDLIVTTVEALPPELRVRIENHPLYKRSARPKIYYGVLEKKFNGMTFDEYMARQKEISIKQFWAMYDAMELYIEHLEKRLESSASRVKRLKSL